MLLKLYIKGDKEQAIKACNDRGIPDRLELDGPDKYGNSLVVVEEQYADKLCPWLTEEPRNAPFPPGSLLYYAYEY